jgi:electron transfer flavoprotein alpha subunit
MIAVVPVRSAALPAGGAEAVAEAGGRALLVGEGAASAADELAGIAVEVRAWDTPGYAPGAWASALAPLLLEERLVILPASPDGRDLAPRIAAILDRPLYAGAVEVRPQRVTTIGFQGTVMADHPLHDHAVVTLQPGVRGVELLHEGSPEVQRINLDAPLQVPDADVREVLPPDVATMDLAEAPRILAGGNGLDGEDRFAQLARVAAGLEAAVGTTRVVTDKGWLPHSRQIGTTGVVVDPRLYVAFGISGAVQHTSGLGQPDHVISVNTDAHCPMMGLADLAVVADANATLDELDRLLASDRSSDRSDTGARR